MDVCCECCVLSDRGLCYKLITRPEESYRLARRCVWVRNLVNEEALAHGGLLRQKQTNKLVPQLQKGIVGLVAEAHTPQRTVSQTWHPLTPTDGNNDGFDASGENVAPR